MSATDNDLQVSTTERKVAFATAADAEYKLADVRVGVRSLTDAFTGSFSSAHLCCAACACNHFLSRHFERREGRGEQLAVSHTGA